MKINIFTASLSVALSGLIAFFLSYYFSENSRMIIFFGSFLSLVIISLGTFSLSFEYNKTTLLIKTTSFLFFGLNLITQIVFCLLEKFHFPLYILLTGSILIVYLLIIYFLSKVDL